MLGSQEYYMSTDAPSTASADSDDHPNYAAIEPDPAKHPSEYSTVERRADVLDHIVSRGSPSAISQSRLAERYEVAQSTISRDVDVLGEAVSEQVGDRLRLATRALHDRLVADLSEADNDRASLVAAWEIHMDYLEWAGVSGSVEDDDGVMEPGEYDHELTDQQREHLGQLQDWARGQIPERDDTVAVPVGDDDGAGDRDGET